MYYNKDKFNYTTRRRIRRRTKQKQQNKYVPRKQRQSCLKINVNKTKRQRCKDNLKYLMRNLLCVKKN